MRGLVSINNNSQHLSGTIGAVGTPSGTKDYNKLKNHPSINGIELVGNLSFEDLGFKKASINGIELDENTTLTDLGLIPITTEEIDTIFDGE